jgi:pseudouridine synthase
MSLQPIDSNSIRLNKHLALHLGISRREADNLINQGHITIDGKAASIGVRVSTDNIIKVDGKILQNNTKYEYIALNKPTGYVCSRKQQGKNPTIYKLLPKNYYHLKPAGRLDSDSSGLIILTNDGDFVYQMTHPSFFKVKIYNVCLDKDLEPLHQQMISDYGINLDDGPSKLQLERMNDADRRNWIVTMHEGRNRQIRRTFQSLGYTVIKLHRTNFGNYSIGDIPSGKFQILDIR